jgi:hypothetical protein
MTAFFPHAFLLAAAAGHGEQRATIFFAQILLLVAVGRLLGEWMQRIGQPAVIGSIAGWVDSGTKRFWYDLAGGPRGDLSVQFV